MENQKPQVFNPFLEYGFQLYDDGNGNGNGSGSGSDMSGCTCNDILLYLKDIRDRLKRIEQEVGIETEPVEYDLYWEDLSINYENPIQPYWEDLTVNYEHQNQPNWENINN